MASEEVILRLPFAYIVYVLSPQFYAMTILCMLCRRAKPPPEPIGVVPDEVIVKVRRRADDDSPAFDPGARPVPAQGKMVRYQRTVPVQVYHYTINYSSSSSSPSSPPMEHMGKTASVHSLASYSGNMEEK